jgi:proprotein convertase subtilisin/kexin type 5
MTCVNLYQGNCGISHHLYEDETRICRVCSDSCKRCDSAGTRKCLSCNDGFILKVLSTTESECIAVTASCGDGFYRDTDKKVCLPCNAKCRTCSSNTVCTACKTGSGRILGANGACQCPVGKMVDDPNGDCPDCTVGCESCSLFPHSCVSCAASRFKVHVDKCVCEFD